MMVIVLNGGQPLIQVAHMRVIDEGHCADYVAIGRLPTSIPPIRRESDPETPPTGWYNRVSR